MDIEVEKARKCVATCGGIRGAQVSLKARLEALDIETGEVHRTQRYEDRSTSLQDHVAEEREDAAADPVTSRLADMLGSSTAHVNVVVGLTFGLLLESLACVGWLLALTPRSTVARQVTSGNPLMSNSLGVPPSAPSLFRPVRNGKRAGEELETARHPVGSPVVTASNSEATPARHFTWARRRGARTDDGGDLARLVAEIAAGKPQANVSDIRRYFRCSQERAMELSRQFSAAMLETARTG
jgi:hypothetical protein